jgi:excinuclease ABC subunit B
MNFKLISKYKPAGDQPTAIKKLALGFNVGRKQQTLVGVTGSGKTFTVANLIAKVQKPTLVIAHNKTLAAQLVSEFRQFFPNNAVEYFVSYYDYYQPEAYMPAQDVFIEKDLEINEEIDKLRHSATAALISRKDVIVVASVSCIYGLGSPEFYAQKIITLNKGQKIERKEILKKLIDLQYARSDVLLRGKFRLHGETFEIMRPDKEVVIRVEIENGEIITMYEYDHLTGEVFEKDMSMVLIFPAKHFVAPESVMKESVSEIRKEMEERVKSFEARGKIVEAERIRRRTNFDTELIEEIGYCSGVENYSLYLSGRKPGESPYTLMDYFGDDFLTIIDESHVTIPQLRAMYGGDFSRKKNLIDFGFRLPSAFDNRPLRFEEFEKKIKDVVFMSATPAQYELDKSKGRVVEQIVRPTGLIDPEIEIRPCASQVKNVVSEIKPRVEKNERVLITTLTKKMAEDLAEHLKEEDGLKSEYLHSGVDTLDRIRILEELRLGKIDVLVGVNLLREGLDLPEVSLVAILDADKEGFLRSETSLIQTIGRAARNVNGQVILYADSITKSMKRAIDETDRRRKKQIAFNKKHGITPKTIQKEIKSIVSRMNEVNQEKVNDPALKFESPKQVEKYIKMRTVEMKEAAKQMEFERAAVIRDEISTLKKMILKK